MRAVPRPVWCAITFLLAIIAPFAQAAVCEIGPIGLTVADLNRELMFYTNTLPFTLVSINESSGPEQVRLLGLSGVRLRVAQLKLGDERIILTEHLDNKGRPIPSDSKSYDLWFQHIAIVVRDMDEAYAQLCRRRVRHVSTAPQTLPAWNKGAGGIKAFYFRDPEDHVLEIIWFPPGKGDPKWRHPASLATRHPALFLGIDHTAIVVSDTDNSVKFYRDALGLHMAGHSENYGTEQEHLNQVFGARLRITSLRADEGPGIEFLEYITPPGGRALAPDAKANDAVFWNTHLFVENLSQVSDNLRQAGAVFVSGQAQSHSQIVRDPDGHAIQLDSPSSRAFSALK